MGVNLWFNVFVIMTALAFLSLNGHAESLDIRKIIQGTVKEINEDSIGILDDLNGHEVSLTLNSNTVYNNVPQWADLKSGDKVQIEYQEDHDKNIANSIIKLEMEGEDSL